MIKRCAGATVAAFCFVLAFAQPGMAAQPRPGLYEQQRADGTAKIALNVDSYHHVSPEVHNRCVVRAVPLTLKVNSAGRFWFHGSAKNVAGRRVLVDITGTFVSSKVATGRAHYRTAKCSAPAFRYRAKFIAPTG